MQAAVVAARVTGIPTGEPRVLHSGWSVNFDLGRTGPVARVGGLTHEVRDLLAHYTRELQVARWLTRARAPVVHPWEPAGPFLQNGSAISFWHKSDTEPPAAPRAAGVALRQCHRALESFTDTLPPLGSLLEEAQRIASSVTLCANDRAIFDHAGVWHYWEHCCRGPIVWDLASLVSTARITGRAPDRQKQSWPLMAMLPGLISSTTSSRSAGCKCSRGRCSSQSVRPKPTQPRPNDCTGFAPIAGPIS